jgi:hypothetical protein
MHKIGPKSIEIAETESTKVFYEKSIWQNYKFFKLGSIQHISPLHSCQVRWLSGMKQHLARRSTAQEP